jgi:hypothetical protein
MKSINRFNLLLKDNTLNSVEKNTINIASNKTETFGNNFKSNRFVSKHVNQERDKKQKEEIFIKSLDSLTEFPELQIKKQEHINLNNKNAPNFLDIIKNNNIVKEAENDSEINCDDNVVPPGWVCIKYDKTSNQEVWDYGDNKNNSFNREEIIEQENPIDVFQRLVDLHRNRKYDYINKWGMDEYDQMFHFQNYDYKYFDKLDE